MWGRSVFVVVYYAVILAALTHSAEVLVEMQMGCKLQQLWLKRRADWILPDSFVLDAGQALLAAKWILRTFPLNRHSCQQLFPRRHTNTDNSLNTEYRRPKRNRTRGKTIPLIPPVAENIVANEKSINLLDPVKVFGWNDPLLPRQWHLFNKRNPGHDVNVVPVWRQGITGKGVVVCIIDDGVDYEHRDLKGKFVSQIPRLHITVQTLILLAQRLVI